MANLQFKTKPDALCAHISDLAARLGAGAKLPSVRVLGESLGVSTRTLHVALGRLEAEGVILRRHGRGIFVAGEANENPAAGRSMRKIALVCNFHVLRNAGHSPFWDRLLDIAQSRAASKNEACQLHLTDPRGLGEGELLESLKSELRAGQVDGVLGIGINDGSVRWLDEMGVPLVTFASSSSFLVAFNTDQLVEMGVETLVEAGCSRVGLWTSRVPSHPAPDAEWEEFLARPEKFFRATLKRLSQAVYPSLIHQGKDERESRGEQGYRIGKSVFSRPRRTWPDSVVSTDDLLTRGALAALGEIGVKVGRDVHIASHVNAGIATIRGYERDILRLEVDPSALVQGLFDHLETLMDGGVPAIPQMFIAPRIVKNSD